MSRLLSSSNAVPFRVAQREATPEKFLPYARHVNNEMVVLDSGDITLTFELQGRAFETADVRDLNDWHTKLNGMLRNLHDERLSIWTHLIRIRVDQYPGGVFKSGFAADLDRAYFSRINRERMFINRFFATLVIRPAATGGDKIIQLFKQKVSGQPKQGPMLDESLIELLDEKARDFEKLMARCEPRRCAIYEYRGLMFSETMEVADMVMTGRHRRVPVVRGHLGGALYRSRTIFGAETIEVRDADTSAFGGIFGIREYPAQTTPRQFEALLSVDFGFVLTQSFTFLGRAAATEKFRLRMTQMENSGDRAVSQADALIDAGDDLMSNRFVLGDHHFTLAVYADSMKHLRDHMSVARAALADTGMVAAREGAALEAAYWSQLVGNFAWRARPAPITSLNFAAFSPFHTFPAGSASGNHWGDAIALLKTNARSPYFFNFHKGDLGHTLIIGPSGGGKTVLLNFLMAQAEKTGARQIFIDKDRGAQIFVQASGGTYLALHNGVPTGFSPLKALANRAEDKSFLSLFIRQLVRADGKPISVQEERLIEDGINAVMKLDVTDRSLSALRSMLGMKDSSGVGARLEKWTSEGSLGWVFDNPADSMTLYARFIGFDMTDFLDNADVRTPVMLYLFHRIDRLLTGERMLICIDEFWKALGDEAFRRFAQDGLKTYRKRNAVLVFATQSPADALKSDISHSILEQVATKIMLPNPFGARRDYVEGFALSEAEFKLVREELAPESHKFLVKQGHDSVVVELDLAGLDDELAVLSGRAETTAVADEVIAEVEMIPLSGFPSSINGGVRVDLREKGKAMKLSIKMLCATLVLATPLPVYAQGMPVHDSASLIQQINAVRQALQIVAQGKEQIAEAQKLYQDLNKLTDIPQLAQQLKSDALRELDISGGSLEGFGNGNLDVVGAGRAKADTVYRDLLKQLGLSGSETSRAAFDLNARNIGIQAGLAENIGAAVTSRTEGLDQLRTRLTTATTAKEVGDLTARLQLESAAMQNDQLRLQAIALQQQAQERARAAEGKAALAQKLDAASLYYKGQ